MSELLQTRINVSWPEGSQIPLNQPSETNIALKIKEYVNVIGHSNTTILTIFMELLTKGKVVVDFQDHTERIELVDRDNRPTLDTAAETINNFVDELHKAAKKSSSKATQSIIAQSNFVKGKTTVVQAKVSKFRLFDRKNYSG